MNTTRNINGRRIEIQARKPRSARGEKYVGWNVTVNEARYFFAERTAEDAINKALIQYLDAMDAAAAAPSTNEPVREPVRDTEIRDAKPRQTGPANDVGDLIAALRNHLSPGAVTLVASCLGVARANDRNVEREVAWFRDQLVALLGGEEYCRLQDELGL